MKNASPLIITISRQLGCGGASIGQQIAKKLNIFYADREIIKQAAEELSMLEEDLQSRDEKKLSFWQSFIRAYALAPDAYVKPQIPAPSDRQLFKTESEIIERIAKERSAVIIGRCGSYILRGHPNHVSIFLHGDIAFRQKRVQNTYNISEEAAAQMIAQSDKARSVYHHTVTGQDWADARRYALCLATDNLEMEKSVEFIMKYLNCRL
jgi:CMP/dCMP kinase